MRSTPRRRPRNGFTLIELITVIAIIGVLAAILIPVANKVRSSARASQCLSNLRQIGSALLLYAHDHGGKLPAVGDGSETHPYWHIRLQPYCASHLPTGATDDLESFLNPVFFCPEWHSVRPIGVGYPTVGYALKVAESAPPDPLKAITLSSVTNLSREILVIERDAISFREVELAAFFSQPAPAGAHRHDGKAHYLFADGHVSGLRPENAQEYFESEP